MQLAPGSYDVLLDSRIIASLVRDLSCAPDQWLAELLTEEGRLPEPFLDLQHRFQTFREVMRWPGDAEAIRISEQGGGFVSPGCVFSVTDKHPCLAQLSHKHASWVMAQKEQQQPRDEQSAPERSDAEVRATIEATQKVLEQSAAEIERAKRLLRETEELGGSAAQPTDTSRE